MSDETGRVILVLLIGGVAAFTYGIKQYFKKKLIENTPTSKVRSIAMGFVELYGKVVPSKQILKSPFTNHDCVYYKSTVEEYVSSGKNSYWKLINSDIDHTLFFLKDNTGKVLVDSTTANIKIPHDFRTQSLSKAPIHLKNFLAAKNIQTKTFLNFKKKMRFTEYYIAPDDKLYILGTAASRPDSESAVKNEDKIISKKGKCNRTFFISDSSEKTLLKKMRWQSPLGIFGGLALFIAGLAILFNAMGIL
jgi:hypothetical protein